MKIKFELEKSKFDTIEYYGKLILSHEDDEIKIDVTVRKGKEDDLFVCYPSKKAKDGNYYADTFLSEDLYYRVNKELNKKFN